MSKKFELTNETITLNGVVLHRIKALVSIPAFDVEVGDLGGFVENESNLSQSGDAWVGGEAKVYGKAIVSDNAQVTDKAKVYGSAKVTGEARIFDSAKVFGNAVISDNAHVEDTASVSGDSKIEDRISVYDKVKVSGESTITGCFQLYGNVKIKDAALSNPFQFKLMESYGGEEVNYDFKFNMYRTISGAYQVFCDSFSGNVEDFLKFVEEYFAGSKNTIRRIKKDTLAAVA